MWQPNLLCTTERNVKYNNCSGKLFGSLFKVKHLLKSLRQPLNCTILISLYEKVAFHVRVVQLADSIQLYRLQDPPWRSSWSHTQVLLPTLCITWAFICKMRVFSWAVFVLKKSFIRLRMSYLHYRLRLSLPNYASSCLFFPQVLALHHSLEAFFHLKLLLSLGAFIGITPQINLLHLLYFRIGFPRGLNIKKSWIREFILFVSTQVSLPCFNG